MLLLIIYLCVALSSALLGYSLLKLFLNDSSYEERVIKSIGVEKISQLNHFVTPAQFYQLTIVLTTTLFLLGLIIGQGNIIGGILLGVIMGVIGLFIPPIVISYFIRKRLEKINEELPGVLEIISSSVHAGLTLNQAIERNLDRMPPTIASEYKIVLNECRLGNSLTDALNHWAQRVELMDVKLMVIASELSLRHGGNLSETYRNLSNTIRERFMFQKEVETLTTEGRMQAIVMTLLPFIILLILTVVRRVEMLEFLASSIGIGSVIVVLVMQIIAYIWIRKVMDIDV